MASNRSYTIIGTFLLGAIILAVAGILSFGKIGLFSHQRQAIVFFNQSVLGLNNGSRVLFRGVQIGTVQNVQLRLNPHGRARIAVTIQMAGSDVVLQNGKKLPSKLTIRQLVERGLRAQLVVYSYVTSQLAVNLDFKPNRPLHYMVPPDQLALPEIPAVPSKISQLKDMVSKIPWKETLKQLNDSMKAMVQLATDLDKTANKLSPGLDKTNREARKTLETVRKAVSENNDQLQATLASVQKLTKSADHQLGKRDQQLDTLMKSVQQTTDNLAQLTKRLNHMAAPDSGTRQDLQSALRNLSAAASSLREFAEKIQRQPHSLLYGH